MTYVKKKKPSILESNIVEKEVPMRVYDERIKLLSIYGTPIPDHFIDEVRLDMKEWGKRETSLRFKDFLAERRINSKVFYDWCNRNAELKQEYEWVLDAIASRREIGAMTRKFDSSSLRMMPRYDQEWLENEQRLAEIKKISQGEQASANTFNVYVEAIPDSPMVPALKGDDE